MSFITMYLVIYGVVALSHIVMQMALGHLDYRRQRRRTYGTATPRVTVVVAAYNEDPALLHRCLLSIDRQDYPELDAIVVDDGSRNVEALLPVHDEFSTGRFRVVLRPENTGKRACQAVVFEQALGDIIITIDSDTVLNPDAIRTLVRRFEDPKVGAVTGNVEVINTRQNLLTRLITYRYWTAFNQERAAQSYFGVVMCASGPFSAYRRSIIDQVRESYISQRFLGQLCSFGDDRHLTNLVLGLGYDVVYDGEAVARTLVPCRIGEYLRQQTRWSKSFYREILWTAKFVRARHPYMGLDLLLQTIMPFALIVALGLTAYAAIADPNTLWRYGAVVAGIGFVRALYGLMRTHKLGFMLFTLYGFIHVFLLIPVRLYALSTMGRAGWGTRTSTNEDAEAREIARRKVVAARSDEGRRQAETAWSRDIRRTVVGGEGFVLHWQPVRDLLRGQLAHAEILLRLLHDGQVLAPADFLSIAERNGLMTQVDERVVRDAVALLEPGAHTGPLRLEVNVSADSMRTAQFTSRVGAYLAQSAVAPRNLVLAISEQIALAEPAAAAAFARRARALGCLVVLDHYGEASAAGDTGASQRLMRALPLDYVKIAGSVVRPLPYSDTSLALLRELLGLAREQGVEAIAAFVGDDVTLELMREEGVEYVQGFRVGTPNPVAVSLEAIADQSVARQHALAY